MFRLWLQFFLNLRNFPNNFPNDCSLFLIYEITKQPIQLPYPQTQFEMLHIPLCESTELLSV